jgi:hypothetical protein
MLAVQLLPLTVTGFARHDAFVIATRVATETSQFLARADGIGASASSFRISAAQCAALNAPYAHAPSC